MSPSQVVSHLLKSLVGIYSVSYVTRDIIVSLETGGAISIEGVDKRAKIILDIKTPDSGENKNNNKTNLFNDRKKR